MEDSPARNCSLCRADDPLQRRAVGQSDGDRLTRARVKKGDGHMATPPADVQCATSVERCLCPEKLICLGSFVGPALSTEACDPVAPEVPRAYALQHLPLRTLAGGGQLGRYF